MSSVPVKLPDSVLVLERGWLCSNVHWTVVAWRG